MNTTRRLLLIFSAALICATVAVLLVFKASASPENKMPPYTGRGDYQRYEAQFFPANAEAQPARPSIGMGDLRRMEAQEANPPTVGMGDLRRVEFQQAIQYATP